MKKLSQYLVFGATALMLSVTTASAAAKHDTPIAPPTAGSAPACDVVKASGLGSLIGKDVKFIPMFNNTVKGTETSMCAYENKAGQHYGLLLRKSPKASHGKSAQQQAAATLAKLKQIKPGSKTSQPKIGEAAVWNPKARMLMVWTDGGKTSLVFIGDKTTPKLATHMAIAKKVLATVEK